MPSKKSKRILFITFSYPPETSATAKRLGSISTYFSKNGWDVTTVTQLPHYPKNEIKKGYEKKTSKYEDVEGVNVFRCKPWIVERDNFVKRLMAEIRFSYLSYRYMRENSFDVVYATCPYMFSAFTGYFLTMNSNAKFVLEFRDITWRYIKSSGKKSFGVDVIFEKIMLWISNKADMLVSTTNGQLDYFLERGVKPQHKLVIPNGVSEDFIDLYESKLSTNLKGDDFTVVYAGLIGFPQSLKVMVEAAEKLPYVSFYLIGDGAERQKLMNLVKDKGLPNVKFPGYLNLDDLVQFYQDADILMAHLKNDPIFEITQPSKVWEYMISGTPVIYGGRGEPADAIEKSGGGLVVSPENSDELVKAIEYLKENPEKAKQLGERGKKYVLNNVRREKFNKRLENNVRRLITKHIMS